MINKTYKRVHSKYSVLFKFIFFLRYLFGIFFIAAALLLFIPKFLDYKKKEDSIKTYLLENYNLKINDYEKIKFNSLPVPNLEIQNVNINFGTFILKTKKLNIFPEITSIYNYKNFKVKKIILNNNKISLKINELKILNNYIYKLKNKLTLNNLDLEIYRKDKPLLNLKKINFSNYGYNKNIIEGEIFKKQFNASIKKDFKEINFKLKNTGLSIKINFNEKNNTASSKGNVRIKILNSNLKFDFYHDPNQLKIDKSFFRSKNLSFDNESLITYSPFFDINSNFDIKDINPKFLNNVKFIKLLEFKSLIKKINIKNKINYKAKNFRKSLIDNLNSNFNLAYGNLVYSKKFLISGSAFSCEGDINLLPEYPILNFHCLIDSKDKKKLLKSFLVKYKKKNEPFNLDAKGNVNILNSKINFKSIKIDENYNASKEDLKYFKDVFENILFEKSFLDIFRIEKIKEFIIEIS